MIQFKTKNSEYRVLVLHNKFHVTKIFEMSPQDLYPVGQTRVSTKMRLEVGDYASFDCWSTAEVVSLSDSSPVKV
jgi:hypothetical protein